MVRDNRHDSTYIFGAICPARGVGAAIITPGANTEMMNLHLAEISTQVAQGAICVLLCDDSGWHRQGDCLEIPGNIVLLPLPSYSPELNPIEKVWDYLRQNKLCSTVWDSYEQIIDACKTAWNWLIADPDRITSIGSREWAPLLTVQDALAFVCPALRQLEQIDLEGRNINAGKPAA
jgi:transposase